MESRWSLVMGMVGEYVALLHSGLSIIGMEISEAERSAKHFGESTRAAVIRLQTMAGLNPTGEIDEATLQLARAALATLQPGGGLFGSTGQSVSGVVSDANGLPLAGATVIAYERDLRESEAIGRAVTDKRGNYAIAYSSEKPIDLQLKVEDQRGTTLFTSEVVYHAPKKATVELALGGAAHPAAPEYLAMAATLAPRLGKLQPEELVENAKFQDLTFLANDAGLDKASVALYSIAARTARTTNLPSQLFYALLRQNVPGDSAVVALATSSDGVDLDGNAQKLLQTIYAASPEVRAAAVQSAIDGNLLPASYATQAPRDLAQLTTLANQAALTSTNGFGKTQVGTLLQMASVPVAKQQSFMNLYANAQGPISTFWRSLYKNSNFTTAEVSTLRFTLRVGRYTTGHLPLVTLLTTMRSSGKIKGARDLARLKASDWQQLMATGDNGKPIPVPKNFTAATPALALETYTRMLERRFERAYPTAAFSARLSEDTQSPFANTATLTTFLDGNTSFSLRRTNVDSFLQKFPKSLANVPSNERATLTSTLQSAQRMLRVSQRYAVMKPLVADGIKTSQQIYAMGRDNFAQKYASHPDIGAVQAARVYNMAEQTYGVALTLAMKLNQQLVGVGPKAVGGLTPSAPSTPTPSPSPSPTTVPPSLSDFPNLATLFGSLDTCSCLDCRSVLSPAAYFVDLLHYLGNRMTKGKSAQAVLLQRRPDLTQIELNCPNTNNVLPYIDLVNELLEDAVAPPADPVTAARARQTTLTTDELNANPQYMNQAAYDKLSAAVYPWSLPFDLPLTEARTYLGQLGVDRVTLMRALQPLPDIGSAQSLAQAIEGLGMSSVEAAIITGTAAHNAWDYWGLLENGNTIVDPVDIKISYSGTWIDVLSHVRVILARSGLDYNGLATLLATTFINPDGSVQINPPSDGSCDLATMTITGLTHPVLDRLHRFARLQTRTGWGVYDLDGAIALLQSSVPVGAGRLNSNLMRQLDAVRRAMQRFQLSVQSAAALLARIDTHDFPPVAGEASPHYALYHDLFQNLAVLSPVDPIFVLNAAGDEIAGVASNPKLTDHRATLAGALQISDADLALAISSLPNGNLTLINLSSLYQRVTLATGLGVSMTELLSLLALVEMPIAAAPGYQLTNPFDGTQPEMLGRFCDAVDNLRATPFSIAQLDYLLRHVYDPTSGVAPDPITTGTLLKSIRDGLTKIASETAFAPDPAGTEVRRRLGTVLGRADVDSIAAILAGTSGLIDADAKTLIANLLTPYLDVAAAQTALVGASALTAGAPRYEYVLTQLLAYFRKTLGTSLIVQQLSDALALPIASVANLVNVWFKSRIDPSKALVTDFLALPSVARDPGVDSTPIGPSESGFAAYFMSYTALDKAAQIINGFAFTTDEAEWVRSYGVGFGWLDPTELPLAATATASGAFARWKRLADADALKTSLPSDGTSFITVLNVARTGGSKAAYFTALTKRTRWSVDDLQHLAGDPASAADKGMLALAYPADFQSERALALLVPAFALLSRLGISANVSNWLGVTLTADEADSIKNSVKAKYSNDSWLTIAKKLRDPLRERQRDALVAWMLAHPPAGVLRWKDSNDVYSYFLIDVEMCACQGTSRIVQANSTIQLFVQRCILNLEPQVVVDATTDADWLQWQWMSLYRVWQANREVFLYPENWLDPTLRKDSSPFYQDLETDLLQNAVTTDSAEDAFHSYLTKLDGVARLEIVGYFNEFETDVRQVLHVIGRKQGNPPTYFYRTWVDSTAWTAWVKIDLDMASDHVLPVIWNNRFYLFWAVMSRKPDATQPTTSVSLSNSGSSISGSAPPSATAHLEIQLAWSEFRESKWQPTQTSPQVIVVPSNDYPTNVTLKSTIDDPLLRIDVFEGSPTNRSHVAEFTLGGVGNAVEAFCNFTAAQLNSVGLETALLGPLPMSKGTLALPPSTYYDGMLMRPRSTSKLSSTRARIAPLYTTYTMYGTLNSEVVLNQADFYRVLTAHQDLWFDSTLPFFYADAARSYFVIPTNYYQNGNYFTTAPPPYVYHPYYKAEYTFEPNYHAFVPLLIRELNVGGFDALFARDVQIDPAKVQGIPEFDFKSYYAPTNNVTLPYPQEGIDFDPKAPYAIYNWELFFHAPMLIANSLSTNQRFQDAKHWYEYIFNPTNATSDAAPARYWITKPFFEMTSQQYADGIIQNLMALISHHDSVAEHQVAVWRADPFDPQMIAQMRPVAFQRAIVMKYLDNLIAWGDNLFRQDTMESVNEATQLYVLAQEILGPRPESVPELDVAAMTYADMAASTIDDFSNVVAAAESAIAPIVVSVSVDPSAPKLPVLPPLYFCVPPNDQLMGHWDTVEDRLYKIRHCQNIQGVFAPLALFAPPINPGMLVRAAAAGLDLGSILSDSTTATPPYRFRVMLRSAIELCQDVQKLGSDLLSALEKRDAEGIGILRANADKTLQGSMKVVFQKAIDDAKQQIDALAKHRDTVVGKQTHFAGLKDTVMNAWEIAAMSMTAGSLVATAISAGLEAAAGTAHAFPTAQFGASGVGGSPHLSAVLGGANVGHAASGWATVARIAAGALQTGAAMSTTLGQYNRRMDEDQFNYDQATSELAEIDSQALAQQIRSDSAQAQLDNQGIVIQTATDVQNFLQSKFTNKDLYEWMISKTSGTYFQAYQLAYTVAQRAEQCFRRELAIDDSSYVQFGYWDSLKKGLLAADSLLNDLRRMEAAYFAQNNRELEITKHASLLALDPYALIELRKTGQCTVTLPELWFDMETPGHYMRRLKTVGVTVPCVAGTYAGVSVTLTLLDSHIRATTGTSPQYVRSPGTDPRFTDFVGGTSAIVTSHGQRDTGMFNTNLDDERYLPFEGEGAIGTWHIQLNAVYPQIDPATISDVILHLSYTARDAGSTLSGPAQQAVQKQLNTMALAESRKGLYFYVSAKQQFATAWRQFLTPGAGLDQVLTLDMPPSRFPFFTHGLDIKITGIDVLAKLSDAGDYALLITRPNAPVATVTMSVDSTIGGLHAYHAHPITPASNLGRASVTPSPQLQFKLQKAGAADFRSLGETEIDDLVLVLQYTVTP